MESLSTNPAPNLSQLFSGQVVLQPHRLAVVHNNLHLSYAQLDREAKQVARQLHALPFRVEEPVAILTPPGAEHIVSQVGVLYAGGTCLPLDPAMSDQDILTRLELAGVRLLLTTSTHSARPLPVPHRLEVSRHEIDSGSDEYQESSEFPWRIAPDHRSHILFTSGTTGTPKGVELLGRGIIRLSHGNLDPDDRVAHVSSVCFDASLLDIWTTLTLGATIVVFEREWLLSPQVFAQKLDEHAVTSLMLTASLFNTIALECPAVFRDCNSVFTAGEAPNIAALTKVLETAPPKRLLNAYGPTECSVLATTHEITLEDVRRGEIPLGKALKDTDLILVNDSHSVVEGEGTGELFIGGDGLSRGYLGNPTKTGEVFIHIQNAGSEGGSQRVYRTNDKVYRDGQGRLFWRGRRNNEIKHRGYRVNLDTIESTLHKTGLVSSAAVLKLQDPSQNASWLVACVVLKDPGLVTREQCQREIIARLPSYMVPQIVSLKEMPVNSNGKIDRGELSAMLIRRRLGPPGEEGDRSDVDERGRLTQTEEKIRSIWVRALAAVDFRDIGPQTSFLELGATSLDISATVMMVRQAFDIPLHVQKIYENPRLGPFANEIDREIHGSGNTDAVGCKRQWLDDANLAEQLEIPQAGAIVDWTASGEGKVFITGVTGFVGAYLLTALIQLPTVCSVKCLVRADSADQGNQRILDNLRKYHLLNDRQGESQLISKIVPVVGDLAHPTLGLDEESYKDLAEWASVIFHFAAQVNYNQPYSSHRASNISGTFNMLKLAATSRLKPVHYASSIAAFGPSGLIGKTVIDEDDSIDAFIDAIPYETGYGQSQWVADKMVKRATERGLPTTILRLGFVLCDSVTGVGNPDDFMGRMISDALTLGVYPLLPLQRKELLPVDYVASAILLLSLSPAALGKAYHVTPDLDEARGMDMVDLFETLGVITGKRLTCLPYEEWVARLRDTNLRGETRLKPLMPILEERVLDDSTRWQLYENMARFRNDNTRKVLLAAKKRSLLQSSSVTETVLGRYVESMGFNVRAVTDRASGAPKKPPRLDANFKAKETSVEKRTLVSVAGS